LKSIKPGRGSSAMGAMGSVFAAVFGVFWTIMATSMGAPIFFAFFGVFFIIMAIVQGVYHYNNATKKNRMSVFDITDENEEVDPFQQRIDNESKGRESFDINTDEIRYCPYCGVRINDDYAYCPKCGKSIRG